MGEETMVINDNTVDQLQYSSYNQYISKVVPEIVEIEEEVDDDNNHTISSVVSRSRDVISNNNGEDVYVAVGKDDLEVLKWALVHAVSPGARVNLIHVFPPISFIPTPVGRLWVNQLSPEQVKVHSNEELNRRKNLLNKYIRLCTDTKIEVDTMLIESGETSKAILDLIPVLNIPSLIMGTKDPPNSRKFIKGLGKGVVVRKYAPEYCKVTLVYHGKQHVDYQRMRTSMSSSLASKEKRTTNKVVAQQKYESNSMQCRCFPVKFY